MLIDNTGRPNVRSTIHQHLSFARLAHRASPAANWRIAVATALLAVPASAPAQGTLVAVDSSGLAYTVLPDYWEGAWISDGVPYFASVGTPSGLAYANPPYDEQTYVSSSSTHALYRWFDSYYNGFLLRSVGPFADPPIDMQGLEWVQSSQTLFGMSDGRLYTINTATGAATLVADTEIPGESSLAFDSLHNVAYMTSSVTDSLYRLDLETATATLIGPLNGPTNPRDMAFVPADDAIYLVCSDTHMLYRVDRLTGQATPLGSMGDVELVGLAWQTRVCPPFIADYDNDGGVTGADLGAFFADYEIGDPCADTDQDGGVTPADMAWFFACYEAC